MHFIFWPALTALISCLIAGQQAVGVPAQRKGNPSDHRRGERQEAGCQTEQQLNWPKSSLIPGFQINCYLQNNQIGLVFYYIGNVLFNALCPKSTSKRLRRLKNDSLNGAIEWKWSNQKKSAVRFKSNFIYMAHFEEPPKCKLCKKNYIQQSLKSPINMHWKQSDK